METKQIEISGKMHDASGLRVGVRWWTAAENDASGIIIIGPMDDAHVALALDRAGYESVDLKGCRGTNSTHVVVLDSDDDPIAAIRGDGDGDDLIGVDTTGTCCGAWADIPVIDWPVDLDRGELTLDDLADAEGTVWNGNNHIPMSAKRARHYVADTRREEEDGNVTWVYDDDGDGNEGLVEMTISDGWTQLDYYATNGYGNDSSTYDIGSEADRKKLTDLFDALEIGWEFSLVANGASNEPAEAWVMIIEDEDLELATMVADRVAK